MGAWRSESQAIELVSCGHGLSIGQCNCPFLIMCMVSIPAINLLALQNDSGYRYQRERWVPGAEQVQEAEDLAGVGHAGEDQADAEDTMKIEIHTTRNVS